MRVVILESSQEVSDRAADLICQLISSKPQCVLGLATGGTPLGTYHELVARHRAGQVSFAGVSTFNLDEYVGLPYGHEQSYRSFMHQHLFELADFELSRCHLPDGNAADIPAACCAYEEQIAAAGGIDLQLLGVGSEGHIAFNESGSSLASRTRIKALTERSRRDNARFFSSLEEVPKLSMTMGVGTILEARQIVLLATGSNKAATVKAFVEGPVTAQVPASVLQLHPRVSVLLDGAAASDLSRAGYYHEVEQIQRGLELQQQAMPAH